MPEKTAMKRMVQKACEICGLLENGSRYGVAVNFVDTVTISRLNKEFVGHEGTTDVISFNYGSCGGNDVDAELFICTDTAEIAAKRLERKYSDEVALYIVHGVLHVSGEEDTTVPERRRMRRLEKKVLSALAKSFDFSEIFPERVK